MFLRNAWYVAGPVEEFEAGVVSRRICNELIAFYTKADGNVAALEDRCPHRFVPLSMGSREGDELRCGYHGLKFGPDGNCTERPGGAEENPQPICVRSYVTTARHAYLWIWMGEAELANPDLIPDFSFITDPQFKCVTGYLMVAGHHELITDNLLDLSHVNFLHPHIASTSSWTEWDNKVVVEGNTVWSMLSRPNQVPGAFQRVLWGSDSPTADGRGSVRWDAPSVLYADTAIAEVGTDIETTGCKMPSAHFLTPETEFSTHYFWVSARNAMIDNDEISRAMQAAVQEVFATQDGPMIAAEQRAMGDTTDFLSHKPLILKADAAGIRARRILRRMIREEQGDKSSLVQEAAE